MPARETDNTRELTLAEMDDVSGGSFWDFAREYVSLLGATAACLANPLIASCK